MAEVDSLKIELKRYDHRLLEAETDLWQNQKNWKADNDTNVPVSSQLDIDYVVSVIA